MNTIQQKTNNIHLILEEIFLTQAWEKGSYDNHL